MPESFYGPLHNHIPGSYLLRISIKRRLPDETLLVFLSCSPGVSLSLLCSKATYLKKVESDSDEANLKNLMSKQVDLIVIDKLVAQHIIKRDMPGSATQLEAVDHPLVIHPLFIIFPKKSPNSKKLCDDFNKGLDMINKDGTIKAIMARSGLM